MVVVSAGSGTALGFRVSSLLSDRKIPRKFARESGLKGWGYGLQVGRRVSGPAGLA